MPGIHEGHRQRLKDQFLEGGMDIMAPHVVLELLLFYAVPQRDTNELAHTLLNHFGSFSAVLDADYHELCQIKGIGPNAATLITMLPALFRRYQEADSAGRAELTSVSEMGEFLRPKFIGRGKEMIFLLCLDGKGRVLHGDFVAEGSIDSAPIYKREMIGTALRVQATAIILAHNHPKGLAVPSNADICSTGLLREAFAAVNMSLIDHFIFAGMDYISMRESGFFTF